MPLLVGLASTALRCDAASSPSYCSQDVLDRYPGGWPRSLDWGIYWFGPGDVSEKAVPGQRSRFYDPKKKTLIYFHGWTGNHGGNTVSCKRITTRCLEGRSGCPSGDQLIAEKWLEDGWNVGFFYWDQFADEDCTRDAEQKVWFDRDGDGLRWKSFDVETGTSEFQEYNETSVADLCMKAMEQNLGDFAGEHMRFVGHSIGAQLAVKCAGMLHRWTPQDLRSKVERKILGSKPGHPAAPHRLALLEPYFTKHHFGLFRCHKVETESGIGSFTALSTVGYAKTLWDNHGVVTEVYKSSAFTEDLSQLGVPIPQSVISHASEVGVTNSAMSQLGEANHDLEKVATVVQYDPEWCNSLEHSTFDEIREHLPDVFKEASVFEHLDCRHTSIFATYFMNYGHDAPQLTSTNGVKAQPGSAIDACETPSPACTDGQIKEWVERQRLVDGGQRWVQDGGKDTFDVTDDTFVVTPDLKERSDVVSLAVAQTPQEQKEEPWWRPRPHAVVLAGLSLAAVAVLGVSMRLGVGLYRHFRENEGSDSDSDRQELDDEETQYEDGWT